MLKITIPPGELSDGRIFWYTKETTLTLEHSLVSLSKWEMKWKKPFIGQPISTAMFDDYVRCMTITQNVDQNVYLALTPDIRKKIQEYIDDPMTAAVIHEDQNKKTSKQFITSDLIYYWMTALQIPFECQKWHLNRLLTLIKIANIEQKNATEKPNKAESAQRHYAMNAARRAKSKMHK